MTNGYTIPNDSFSGTDEQRTQATPWQTDIDVLVAGYDLTGVASGCAVTAQAVPDMTVLVASGTVAISGALAAVAGGNATITANAASFPRVDLVVADAAGAVTVVAGTPAAAPATAPPSLPASRAALAMVYVKPGATTIHTTDIVLKGVMLNPRLWRGNTTQFSLGAGVLQAGVYQERFRTFAGDIDILGVSAAFGFGYGPAGGDVTFDLVVENAGGVGTTLWPLHPGNRPKVVDGAEVTVAEVVPETTRILANQSLRPFVVSPLPATPGSYCVMNMRWRWAT